MQPSAATGAPDRHFEIIIVGATPGGIMAAISAGRHGRRVLLLERTAHIGGMPANGLGATDIATGGATGGLFAEFTSRVADHYRRCHGEGSEELRASSDGHHFEPHVAEQVFEAMLAEQSGHVTVLRMRQFDADPAHVVLRDGAMAAIAVTNRTAGGQAEWYAGSVFIDATYEGDLAAAAGAPFRLGREPASAHDEPMAGRIYKTWGVAKPAAGSTGAGDNAVQAYNYRLCLSRRDDRLPITRPACYRREEYASLVEDLRANRFPALEPRPEVEWDGIGRVVNIVYLPHGKTDANNQHAAFLSTDLPEENWPWPTSGWEWRDRFAIRLRDYTLGLLWFVQHDPELPEAFRRRCSEWGLAAGEYIDNSGFPRQVYVREGRRIEGEHLWTAHDALPVPGRSRPPLHADSVTASHYALDSHAVRKREPGRAHLDGFSSHPTAPYTVPYGVMVPKQVDGLLTPVPVSGTHVGFSTLRMEPCWMALGQAAGVAACLSLENGCSVRHADVTTVQERLLQQGAVLVHFRDTQPSHPCFKAVQHFALRGLFGDSWEAAPDRPATAEEAGNWAAAAGVAVPAEFVAGSTPRGRLLQMMLE